MFLMENPHSAEHNSLEVLEKRLRSAKIPIDSWGEGSSKTIGHLLLEIEEGECELVERDGDLFRLVNVVVASVYYQLGEKKYKLKEDKQVFDDGRVRVRNLDGSVFEKVKTGENVDEAMARGISEELGIDKLELRKIGTDVESMESKSYPGLKSEYVNHRYDTYIDQDDFSESGYVEEQKDKKTYFVWELC